LLVNLRHIASRSPARAMRSRCSYVIDGSKVVLLRGDDPEVKVEEVTFEPNEVYSIDIVMSTGEGKPRETEARTTVFKLAPEASYRPKMKAAQTVQREAMNRFTVMPFTLRALENESQARMGIVELLKHGVVHSYPVLHEREGALLAHVKFTALLLPGGTLKITGLSLPAHVISEKKRECRGADGLGTLAIPTSPVLPSLRRITHHARLAFLLWLQSRRTSPHCSPRCRTRRRQRRPRKLVSREVERAWCQCLYLTPRCHFSKPARSNCLDYQARCSGFSFRVVRRRETPCPAS
jgi:hypothetical protein